MIIIKLFVKIALLPVFLMTIIGQWIGAFFTGIASIILGLLSTLAWVVAILSYLMGISSDWEALQIMVIAFAAFIISQVCAWLIEGIVALRYSIEKFMRS